jgi:hypothetical protein
MLRKTFVDALQQLDPLLRVVSLTFEHDERARELIDHVGLAALQLILPARKLFEFALLPLNRILLPLQRNELFLRLLHLIVEVLAGQRFVVGQIEEGFFRSRALSHVSVVRGL